MYKISVVVSTWRRPQILCLVLSALAKQTFPQKEFEVIVVDSNSCDDTPNVVANTSRNLGLNVRLVHVAINSLSAKRNKGLSLAVGRFVVFLDDDCVPDADHLSHFDRVAKSSIGQQVIWCGGVRFNKALVSSSNYYRYRDSCHFSSEKKLPAQLEFKTIVAMNMLVERELLLADGIVFDERFVGYGCEDMEFGYRLENAGYRILPCCADIEHVELLGDITKFCTKFFHFGRDGMQAFWEVAGEAVKYLDLGQSFSLEPVQSDDRSIDRIKKCLIHLVLDSPIPEFIRIVLDHTDRMSFFYSRLAYRFVLAGAFRKGVKARMIGRALKIEASKDGWYS